MINRRLALLGAAAFATMAALRVCDGLLPSLARDFSATSGQAGQTVSAFAVAYGLALLVYGPIGDRRDKFGVAAVCTLACTVGSISCALAPSLNALIASRALWGSAAAGVTPIAMAWIGDTVPYERRQEVLAHLIGATTLGLITGQSMGGVLADTLGWRSAFWVLASVFAGSGTLLCMDARKDLAPTLSEQSQRTALVAVRVGLAAMRGVFGDPWARRVLGFSFLEGVFVFGGLAFLPSYLHQRFGLSMSWAGAVLVLYGAGGVIYSRIAKTLLRRFGQVGLARGGSALMCVYFSSLAALSAWGWALPACLIGGLGFYMLHGTLQTYATQMVPASRGTAVTMFSSCLFMGNSVGVVIAAMVVDLWSAIPVSRLRRRVAMYWLVVRRASRRSRAADECGHDRHAPQVSAVAARQHSALWAKRARIKPTHLHPYCARSIASCSTSAAAGLLGASLLARLQVFRRGLAFVISTSQRHASRRRNPAVHADGLTGRARRQR